MNLKKGDFLKKHNLHQGACDDAGITWNELKKIAADHAENTRNLEPTAHDISSRLQRVPEVHSLKYRIKNPEHLIAKIIRKRMADAERKITLENYTSEITDLIGLRVLHLFKGDWIPIHKFITDNYDLVENPIAYIREGDPEEQQDMFRHGGCEIKPHPAKYRSVHYLVKSHPTRKEYVAELQVRTIFEEGWSEIDHRIRYPHNLDNSILNQFLILFNRLAGQADEMGSFVTYLAHELSELAAITDQSEKERLDTKKQFENLLEKSRASEQEKAELKSKLRDYERAAQAPSIWKMGNRLAQLNKESNPESVSLKMVVGGGGAIALGAFLQQVTQASPANAVKPHRELEVLTGGEDTTPTFENAENE